MFCRRQDGARRVLLVEPCYENYGGYFRAYGMARALALAGFDVTLLISSRKRFTFRIERTRPEPRLAIHKLPRTQFNPWLTGRFLRAGIALLYCVFGRYDLIHLFTIVQIEALAPFLFLRLLAPWKKVVLDWDDYWTYVHLCMPPGLYARFPLRLVPPCLRFCEYRVQRLAKHGTCTSRLLEAEFRRIGVGHVLRLINGVDTTQFVPQDRAQARTKLGLDPRETILLMVGHTCYGERVLQLMKVFEALWRIEPTARLLCTVDLVSSWKQYRTTEEMDPAALQRIRRVGLLYGEQLAAHLAAADAVLFMMGELPTEKACFPTRIGTYLNAGRAIIMNETDTEACRVMQEWHCAVIDKTPERIAARAMAVLRDPVEAAALAANITRAREALSWETLGGSLAAFYREVLGDGR